MPYKLRGRATLSSYSSILCDVGWAAGEGRRKEGGEIEEAFPKLQNYKSNLTLLSTIL
jgi:hypothetical protein